jgi:hypothetical protein
MGSLSDILREEVGKYAADGRGANVLAFSFVDDIHRAYSVVLVDYPQRQHTALVAVLARLVGDKIIIEEDNTDKPLLDALLQRGVPRENILLAYDGAVVPEELAWFQLKSDVRPT